ncbi:TonB-dependent receptor [Roseibacillus persicicus]|uniref:TonB-dependent receptor n=1 Tax=Roseibacillus persicicus TaxID=454148 RepID=UPI00280DE918|nr:TonB-dependent receptor [Roseibacillus persicicus]MDQ8190863.1 TonB-dependent receptor [Roseibacillus persicicus]
MKKLTTIFLVAAGVAEGQDAVMGVSALEETIVTGKAQDVIGEVTTSTQGQANNEELSQRPFLRRGELLEVVPGVIITQHAGGGKANQYFVRGYNLDHGTDFHIGVDGMPGNYRTHAHGQGYADLNFIVPEFVERLDYFKGPFFAEYGDLSTAGGADYTLIPYLEQGIASFSYGENDYYRALLGNSWEAGGGFFTFGGEFTHEDGPWLRGNDYNRYNGLIKWYTGDEDNFLSLTALFHTGEWNSSDQIPLRAVESGLLDEYGAIDDTTGGDTERHSLSFKSKRTEGDWVFRTEAWVGHYALDLFSNFTYFTDPVNGDQFEQEEERIFAGLNIAADWSHGLGSLESRSTLGFQTQHDWIDDIGLYTTNARVRNGVTNVDDVYQGSYGIYFENETRLTDWARLILGARGDFFHFDVESGDNPADTSDDWDAIFSPKAGLVLGPWNETEFYLNAGMGFHSNDARGVTAAIDPVDALVRTRGAEVGMRTRAIEGVSASIGLWWLDSDSEFVYVGDEGTTEAGPASERYGVEASIYWRPHECFTFDAEYAWSYAQADVGPGEFSAIDNSVPHMASAGVTIGGDYGWFGSLRGRYFSRRPLLGESSKTKSRESIQVNGRVGYRWENLEVSLDVLNILDREDRDIEYFYESQLPGEAAPVEGIHYHPAEPRQIRANVTYRW